MNIPAARPPIHPLPPPGPLKLNSTQIQHPLPPHIPSRQILHLAHAPPLHNLHILPAQHAVGRIATPPVPLPLPEGLVLARAAPQVGPEHEQHQPRRRRQQLQRGQARSGEGQAGEDGGDADAEREAVALEHALGADGLVLVRGRDAG